MRFANFLVLLRMGVIVMAETRYFTYGFSGTELVIDNHVKKYVIFAIADEKKNQLAWYVYVDDLPTRWQGAFDLVGTEPESRKLDHVVKFGSVESTDVVLDVQSFKFDIGKLAGPKVRSVGTPATLDINDDGDRDSRFCMIFIDAVKPHGMLLSFFLKNEEPRRGFNIKANGNVYFFGIERFSLLALKRGITKTLTPIDPHETVL